MAKRWGQAYASLGLPLWPSHKRSAEFGMDDGGENYIYGTSNVLSGLAYHCYPNADIKGEIAHVDTGGLISGPIDTMLRKAVRFLVDIKNLDGGWGEYLQTYQYTTITPRNWFDVRKLLLAPSTPSQTAWALMGILPYLLTDHSAID